MIFRRVTTRKDVIDVDHHGRLLSSQNTTISTNYNHHGTATSITATKGRHGEQQCCHGSPAVVVDREANKHYHQQQQQQRHHHSPEHHKLLKKKRERRRKGVTVPRRIQLLLSRRAVRMKHRAATAARVLRGHLGSLLISIFIVTYISVMSLGTRNTTKRRSREGPMSRTDLQVGMDGSRHHLLFLFSGVAPPNVRKRHERTSGGGVASIARRRHRRAAAAVRRPRAAATPAFAAADAGGGHKAMDFGGLNIRFFDQDDERRSIYHDVRDDQGEVYDPATAAAARRNRKKKKKQEQAQAQQQKRAQAQVQEQEQDSSDEEEEEEEEEESSSEEEESEELDWYYAFDDDRLRNPYHYADDEAVRDKKMCRRVNWHKLLLINCNSFHEVDLGHLARADSYKFLGAGAYRAVYETKLQEVQSPVAVVFKHYDYTSDMTREDFEYMRMDAIVAERLSYSPRIVNIYGYCGLSMMNEYMSAGDVEELAVPAEERVESLRRLEEIQSLDPYHVHALNYLTPTQKLNYSADMAEAVLLLHSFEDGIMVHDDIQLSQFLLPSADDNNNHLKLNDFNRAEIMLWNEQDQEYCRYRNNPGHGDWRAPEEYLDRPLNEKIDIWSLGNNMHALLTGMDPYFNVPVERDVKKHVMAGEVPYMDPRWLSYEEAPSFAEWKLAEIMQYCWTYNPDDRIDIFELVTLLRQAVEENEARVLKTQ